MTYCVGIVLDEGMVFASDSRTNAGVDNVSSFSKMRVFEKPGDSVIVALSSGNLSITQSTIALLEQNSRRQEGGQSIWSAQSMYDVATLLGDTMRQVRVRDGAFLQQSNVDVTANFIVGGQIKGEEPRLFLVYSEGNFIEASSLAPFLQIGETKYGRPVLDRVITRSSSLVEAAKCALVSFDSTMRSNISVGLPIDLVVYDTDTLKIGTRRRIEETDPYYSMIHREWGEGLRRVFTELPDPDWRSLQTAK